MYIAVFPVDRGLSQFISNVNNYWRNSQKVNHVTVVSTGGGYRDNLVRLGLTSLKGVSVYRENLVRLGLVSLKRVSGYRDNIVRLSLTLLKGVSVTGTYCRQMMPEIQ